MYIYEKIDMIKFWKLNYFQNINIHVVFILNNFLFYSVKKNFLFYIYNTVKYLHRTR